MFKSSPWKDKDTTPKDNGPTLIETNRFPDDGPLSNTITTTNVSLKSLLNWLAMSYPDETREAVCTCLTDTDDLPSDLDYQEKIDRLEAVNSNLKSDNARLEEQLEELKAAVVKPAPAAPSLPEGMWIADHKHYGRVVVAPNPAPNGRECVFRLEPRDETGAWIEYANADKLTRVEGGDLPEGMWLADVRKGGRVVVSPRVDGDGEVTVFGLRDNDCGAYISFVDVNDLTRV